MKYTVPFHRCNISFHVSLRGSSRRWNTLCHFTDAIACAVTQCRRNSTCHYADEMKKFNVLLRRLWRRWNWMRHYADEIEYVIWMHHYAKLNASLCRRNWICNFAHEIQWVIMYKDEIVCYFADEIRCVVSQMEFNVLWRIWWMTHFVCRYA